MLISPILTRSQNEKPNGKRLRQEVLIKINDTVGYVNEELGKLAYVTEKLYFLFHLKFYCEDGNYCITRNIFSDDGLHLSFKGTPYTLVNVYVNLLVFTHIASTS